MEEKKKNPIKIGWSEVSITPEKKICLAGQFYQRVSQYVETPIVAVAMAIESGGEQMVLCSVDLESIDPGLTKAVKKKIGEERSGLDPEKIIIAATHSHTSFVYEGEHDPGLNALADFLGSGEDAPEETPLGDDVMTPAESTAFLCDRIAKAVSGAWANRAPAYYTNEFGRAAVGLCRRVCYRDGSARMWGDCAREDFFALEGGNDSGMELLFTYDENRKLSGVVINLACPAQVLEQRYFISSDFWGKVRILLRRELGEDLKILGICAPAGDQCPRDLIRWVEPETPIEDPNVIRDHPPVRKADPSMYDIKGTWTIGRRIATEVLAILGEVTGLRSEDVFCHKTLYMPLPLRRVTEEENAVARRKLREFAETHAGCEISFEDNAAMHVYAGIAVRYDRQQRESVVPSEVHIARLGDIAIATSPFELFLDFANIIRARSAAQQTFLVQLACDSKGYLPTEKAEKGGHYSAYVSSGHVGHEGGEQLTEETLREIREMFS